MSTPLRVLIAEDREGDAALIVQQLRDSGYDPQSKRVATPEALGAALADSTWDIVISDYLMPHFSGLEALAIVQEINPDVPLIIVSGVIGEETAVAALKAGTCDYVMKDNLMRLGPAVQRALEEAQERTARRQAEEALRESEEMYKTLVRTSPDSVITTDLDGTITWVSQHALDLVGAERAEELVGRSAFEFMVPEDHARAQNNMQKTLEGGILRNAEYTLIRKDGTRFTGDLNAALIKDAHGNPKAFIITARDVTERRQVEEVLRLRVEQLDALSQASQAVTASLELDQVLARIVSLAHGVVGSDYTGVVLVDETGRIGQSAEDLPGMPALQYRIRDRGLTNWIVHSRRPAIIEEIREDGVMNPHPGRGAPRFANPVIVKAGVKSLAGLPLLVKNRLLGVLYLHSLHPGAFHDQLPLLTAFANQVAVAIENARLFEAEQRQTRRLTLLAEIARIAATTYDADALLQAVAESICRYFPMVVLFTLEEEGHTLVLRGSSGSAVVPTARGHYRQSVELGINGYVARTGKPYLMLDVHGDPYFYNPDETPIQSALCVPILDDGDVVGTIDVESERLADFGAEDRSLLEAVADTVAIGLRNAHLHQETRRRLQELTFLNRISAGLTSLDLDTLIAGALDELHELVQADRTYFITVDPDTRTWQTTHERVAEGIEPDIGLSGTFDDVPNELETLLADQPFAISDIATDPRVEVTRELYRSLGMQSMLLVPVLVGGRLRGALGFDYCRERHVWLPDEIRLLEGVAHQLELALENVCLFEEARLRADELAAALARLEEMDRLKDQFLQNVSHELRSPLALIRGYAELLNTGELGELRPEQHQPVAVIARRARMLGDLVRDITLILEAESNPPRPEAVPLGELATAIVEDFQVITRQADLELRAEIPPDLPPASGYPIHLRRVLDNLLSNAVKFTPAGGTITVRLWQEEKQVVLEVSDTGIGIPADQLERIFERFYQVDGSIKRRHGGVGLGLALVKEITEAFGGHVAVTSQVGKGSTFTVTLPVFTGTRT